MERVPLEVSLAPKGASPKDLGGATSNGMNRRSIKIILILVAIALALFALVAILKNFGPLKNIINPPQSAFPPGTKIENLKDVPREFPSGIVSAEVTFTRINTIKYPDGKEDITLAYNSTKKIEELFNLYYSNILKAKVWKIQSSQLSANSAVILAVNNLGNKLFVTIAANKNVNTVTFLFKK